MSKQPGQPLTQVHVAENNCTGSLKIKALNGLHLAIGNNKGLRMLEVLYVIKALWVDCPMPNSPQAVHQVASALGICTKQVNRIMVQLQQNDLIRSYTDRGHDAISWDELRERYSINHKHFYHIDFKPIGKKGQKLRLWHILYTKVVTEKKQQCKHAFKQRVKHNEVIEQVLNEVAGNALDAYAVATHQLRCFVTEGAIYSDEERYVLSTHYMHKDDKILRGDLELNQRTLRKIHGYKGYGSVTYMDRQCQQLGLIVKSKRIDVIPGHTTRGSRRNDRQGFIKYDRVKNELLLIRCSAIEVLPLKGLEERLQKLLPYQKPEPTALRSERVKRSHITRKIKKDEAKTAA